MMTRAIIMMMIMVVIMKMMMAMPMMPIENFPKMTLFSMSRLDSDDD